MDVAQSSSERADAAEQRLGAVRAHATEERDRVARQQERWKVDDLELSRTYFAARQAYSELLALVGAPIQPPGSPRHADGRDERCQCEVYQTCEYCRPATPASAPDPRTKNCSTCSHSISQHLLTPTSVSRCMVRSCPCTNFVYESTRETP